MNERTLFIKYAKEDLGFSLQEIDNFLSMSRQPVFKLNMKTRDHFDIKILSLHS